jgi:glycosyltransferase involved in cell wall biosynthesis
VPPAFSVFQTRIEKALAEAFLPTDIVIVHNVLSMHFNLALTAAIHHLQEQGSVLHLIAWCHDISRYVNPDSGEIQRRGFPWDLLRTYKQAITYVAVSPGRQRLLAKVFRTPAKLIRFIPNGVDAAQILGLSALGNELAQEFGLFLADLVLLMPVRITRAKNVEFALHVAEYLKKTGIRLRLVITGPPDPHVPDIGAYYRELKELRQALSLSEEVIFAYEGTRKHEGPLILGRSIVGEMYRLADLVLMPSLREGFGLPVLEAAMADRAVFATSVPVIEELPEFAYLIQPDESAESVAARIREWAAADAAHRLRKKVRQEFTWPAIFSGKLMPLIQIVTAVQQGQSP